MQRERNIVFAVIWMFAVGGVSMAYKWVYTPSRNAADDISKQQAEQELLKDSSGQSKYKHHPKIGIDSFSGYAILRSDEFKKHAGDQGIQINLVTDDADYVKRLKALKSGDLDMAVFTWGALIQASEEIGDIPAVGVCVIDETVGADLMVGYKKRFPNIDALNRPETTFVLLLNSPSETIVRVLMSQFKMDRLAHDPFLEMSSPEELFNHYRNAKQDDPYVYVTWQPWGTKILDNPNTHTIIDSSRFKGYVVDVLVCSRPYLVKHGDVVKQTIASYLRAVNDYKNDMLRLVIRDAATQGQGLSRRQAEALVDGIVWKNTQENYAHFRTGGNSLQYVEDMIRNLTDVLKKTGAIRRDPTDGKFNRLYYPNLLQQLADENFHPGLQSEAIRSEARILPMLTASEWNHLAPVGTLEVPKLVFARGTSRLNDSSKLHLDGLIETLKAFPAYYVQVKGDAATIGNLDANQVLALARARVAVEYLTAHGIHKNRVQAVAGMPTGETAVNFVLGEMPY